MGIRSCPEPIAVGCGRRRIGPILRSKALDDDAHLAGRGREPAVGAVGALRIGPGGQAPERHQARLA